MVAAESVEDEDFISLVAAAEAEALATERIKRQKVSAITVTSPRLADPKPQGIQEGSYMAALRGSRSSLCQQQQEFELKQQSKKRTSYMVNTSSSTQQVVVGGGSGACFKCGMEGHWARDCTGGRIEGSQNVGGDGADVAEKPCPCGVGACLVRTSNTAKNPGRKFYRCPVREENGGCNFFEWCDTPSSGFSASASIPKFKPNSSVPVSSQPAFGLKSQAFQNNFGSQFNNERSSSSCFKCKQEGHWSRDCPNQSSDSSADFRGTNPARQA